MRRLRLGLWVLAAAWAVGLGVWTVVRGRPQPVGVLTAAGAASRIDAAVQVVPTKNPPAKGTAALAGTPAPALDLRDAAGRPRSLAGLRGRAVVLAFIDPANNGADAVTAQALLEAQALLPATERSRVALVAVDANPTDTSPAAVRSWSVRHGMTGRWWFLTGSPAALARVWRGYAITVTRVPAGRPDVHTRAVYVLSPTGREAYLYPLGGASTAAGEARPLATDLSLVLTGAVRTVRSAAAGAELASIEPGGAAGRVRLGGPRLLDFFATWCHACNLDMATLAAYARAAPARGLPPVVAVDLRLAEPSTAYVRGYAVGHKLPFPVALDATGSVSDRYGVTDLPTLILLDRAGKAVWRHTGVLSLASLEAAVAAHAGRG